MKIITIVGARPQFIKAAIVSRLLRSKSGITEILVHTGQHYDHSMSEVFFNQMEIPAPDFNLGVGSATHGTQTARMLEGIETILLNEKPRCVMVYGDTNSTLAGSLAAAKLGIYGIHIEAGLRSFNRRMPEEINRVLTDHAVDLLFTPTETAVVNLQNEGIEDSKIFLVGDVMYDAFLYYGKLAQEASKIINCLRLDMGQYILATIHRAENTDNEKRLFAIIETLQELADYLPIVMPIHPRTRLALQHNNILNHLSHKLILIEPVGYLDMIMLEKNARLILTDSGGVQKEAFFQRVPCVTIREQTEWVELVELGWNLLMSPELFKSSLQQVIDFSNYQGDRKVPVDLYGGGAASQNIVDIILKRL